jgi:starvation-inducible outer membrane lipoprotein
MIKKLLLGIASLYFLSGCASSPKEIQPSFVSPLQYKDYNCDQIVEEMSYVNRETVKLYTHLEKKSGKG